VFTARSFQYKTIKSAQQILKTKLMTKNCLTFFVEQAPGTIAKNLERPDQEKRYKLLPIVTELYYVTQRRTHE
jgi:hypothetical protein